MPIPKLPNHVLIYKNQANPTSNTPCVCSIFTHPQTHSQAHHLFVLLLSHISQAHISSTPSVCATGCHTSAKRALSSTPSVCATGCHTAKHVHSQAHHPFVLLLVIHQPNILSSTASICTHQSRMLLETQSNAIPNLQGGLKSDGLATPSETVGSFHPTQPIALVGPTIKWRNTSYPTNSPHKYDKVGLKRRRTM